MTSRIYCSVLALCFSVSLQAEESLAVSKSQIFSEPPNGAKRSALFVRLSDGKTIFEQNADDILSPASVTKVITSAAALAKWGPRHKFQTRVYADGAVQAGVVQGSLVLVGDGDPYLVNEQLWQLANDLSHIGIKKIKGDIVLDNSLFDREIRDESRRGSEKASQHAYDAPITPLGVNFNTLTVALVPGDNAGDPVNMMLDPYRLPNVILDNKLKTSAAHAQSQLSVDRVQAGLKIPALRAQGTVSAGETIRKVYRSTIDPVLTAGEIIKAFLEREGIQVMGNIREGRVSRTAKPLYALDSYELARVVQGLNKFSNNYVADVITKRLGAAFPPSGSPDGAGQGTYANGVAAIERFLREDVGIKTPFQIRNGSGLDTDNRVSARQVVQVLRYVESRFDLFPEFLMSLPSAGEDGTLAKRFKSTGEAIPLGLIRAKTGTLSQPISVAGLAGYLRHPKHGMVAFAVLDNGVAAKSQPSVSEFRARQDVAIVKFLQE